MNRGDYVERLEKVVKQLLIPLKNIPFNLVIEVLSGKRIIPFDLRNKDDLKILECLKKAAVIAGKNVNRTGILRPRPNEVGNDIEPFVKAALKQAGYKSETPLTKGGDKKSAGYPDIAFTDHLKRINYLECKTYNKSNIATTQRSFYLSPSDEFKVTHDAHHFVISYEIFVGGRRNGNNIYRCKAWKILSIENLEVDVKFEFNSDNRRLYARDLILADGDL